MGSTSANSAQIGRKEFCGINGSILELNASQRVRKESLTSYNLLIMHLDIDPPTAVHAKTINTPVSIAVSASGAPELPAITMRSGYKAKIVQSMLREYCTKHIRELPFDLSRYMCNMYELGFLNGMKTQTIPWGSIVKDPLSWITEESVPHGFQWKDPSKIQMGEIFRLLDHWRDRKDQGLDHLIWVPTCPFFQGNDIHSQTLQNIVQPTGLQDNDSSSDEETFIIPQSNGSSNDELFIFPDSDDIAEANPDSSSDGPSDANSSEDSESIDMPMESPTVPISPLHELSSGEHDSHCLVYIYLICVV